MAALVPADSLADGDATDGTADIALVEGLAGRSDSRLGVLVASAVVTHALLAADFPGVGVLALHLAVCLVLTLTLLCHVAAADTLVIALVWGLSTVRMNGLDMLGRCHLGRGLDRGFAPVV